MRSKKKLEKKHKATELKGEDGDDDDDDDEENNQLENNNEKKDSLKHNKH